MINSNRRGEVMTGLGKRGIASRTSIISLFVIVTGIFVLVKYSEINKIMSNIEQDAQKVVRSAKENTNEELRDIQQTAQQSAQITEQRLNRSFDSYRRKLQEIDNSNKKLISEWDKEFTGLMDEYEERISLKEQELDRLIAVYHSKLDGIDDELPISPAASSPIAEDIEELQRSGDSLADQNSYADAISQYKKAADILEEKAPHRKGVISSLYTMISENYLNIYDQSDEDDPDMEALEGSKKYASLAMTEDSTNARAPYLLARVLNEEEEDSDDLFDYLARALDNNGATLEMVENDFSNMEKDDRFLEFIEAYRK